MGPIRPILRSGDTQRLPVSPEKWVAPIEFFPEKWVAPIEFSAAGTHNATRTPPKSGWHPLKAWHLLKA